MGVPPHATRFLPSLGAINIFLVDGGEGQETQESAPYSKSSGYATCGLTIIIVCRCLGLYTPVPDYDIVGPRPKDTLRLPVIPD